MVLHGCIYCDRILLPVRLKRFGGRTMRNTIRLLTAGALVLFVVAILAAQHGEQAMATLPTYQWPGLAEELVPYALLALTVLLFVIVCVLALLAAVRAGDRLWVRTIAVLALGIGIVYLGLFLPDGFLVPLVQPYLPRSPFQALLLVYLPALGGMVLLKLYSRRAPHAPPPAQTLWHPLARASRSRQGPSRSPR